MVFLRDFNVGVSIHFPYKMVLVRNTMTKIDPHNSKKNYDTWKCGVTKNGIPDITKLNSDILLKYLDDMELGLNVNRKGKKGSRSYPRLNSIRSKMIMIIKESELRYGLKSILDIEEIQIVTIFNKMRKGDGEGGIKTRSGGIYKSTGDYVKVFRAFWNWYIKVKRKEGVTIKDIVSDLDSSTEKPKWVYLNEEQMETLLENVKSKYKVLFSFLYDTGLRSPTELVNIKVRDFTDDFRKLTIREEVSKTFERKISVMFSRKILKRYIERKKLNSEDYIFPVYFPAVNRYLKRQAKELFGGDDGEEVSEGGEKFCEMTMYDIRHISCCYWLPRYKSESSLMYRFGWKKSSRIHYYSEFLGMKDNITEEDLLVDVTKTQLESELVKVQRENELVSERLRIIEGFLKEYSPHIKELYKKKYGSDEYVI